MSRIYFEFFYKFIKPYKGRILITVLLQVFTIICSISIPYLLGDIIHQLEIKEVNFYFLIKRFIILVLIYFVWDFTKAIVDILFEKVNKGVENDLREYCYDKILNSPMTKLKGQSEGEIITKVIRDTEKVEKIFSSLFKFGTSLINSAAIIFMMFVVSKTLALIIVLLFTILIIIHRIMIKPLKKLYIKYKHSEENLLTDLRNQLTGFLTIKVFSIENESINMLRERNKINFNNHMSIATKVSIIKYFNFFTASVYRIATVIIGGWLFLLNKINIGQIFSIHTYTIQLSYELRVLIELDILLRDIFNSFTRIVEFLFEFEDEEVVSGIDLNSIDSIKFDEVNFQYEKKKLIDGLSFCAKKGDVIGIKGRNGSGKTTLTYLLCGFYKPDGIYINDYSIDNFNEKEILNNTSYVLQNVHLFPATIKENLTCFKDIDDDLIYEVCKDIGLHEKILKFPNGYRTIVDEKNLNLSGGEKQLISLGRALLKESDIIILDEMNSALDTKTEDKLLSNISKYIKNKITFMISHKENAYNICNGIIDLDKNEVFLLG